ncbi:GIY-YIG nuclease family protein [Streptomyces virginiae]|uniref:GIY-YIG nuclease family protein n=1 Tax=Streptomyces virginiae TaxID=1961 RepID=UPI003666C54B
MTHALGQQGRTALYRLFDADGVLLYIGIASYPEGRWREHAGTKRWWHLVDRKTVDWFDTRVEALAEEARATQEESPQYDQSFRLGKGYGLPKREYDDADDVARVRAHMTAALESGTYRPGDSIKASRIAQELGVAPITAKMVFWRLCGKRRLKERGGGYYRVLSA